MTDGPTTGDGTAPASPPTRRLFARRLLGGLGGVVALAAITYFTTWHLPIVAERNSLIPALDEALAESEGRWERPVLRGPVLPGNAAEVQRAAIEAMALPEDLVPRDTAARIVAGQIERRLVAAMDEHRQTLATYRDSTQRGYSWTVPDLAAGPDAETPEFGPALRAAHVLLAAGRLAGPDACLQAGTDVIRLGQDLAPGAMLPGLLASAAHVDLAVPVVARCLPEASPGAVGQAAAELELLARNMPPIGQALRFESISLAVAGEWLTRRLPIVPTTSDERYAWTHRRQAVGLLAMSLAELDAWSAADEVPYPARRERLQAVLDARLASDNEFLENAAPEFAVVFDRDAVSHATVRLLALAAADLARADARTGAPPKLADPAFADPFTGAPMAFERSTEGNLSIWSVGPSPVDPQEPRDPAQRVVLTVAAPSAAPPAQIPTSAAP